MSRERKFANGPLNLLSFLRRWKVTWVNVVIPASKYNWESIMNAQIPKNCHFSPIVRGGRSRVCVCVCVCVCSYVYPHTDNIMKLYFRLFPWIALSFYTKPLYLHTHTGNTSAEIFHKPEKWKNLGHTGIRRYTGHFQNSVKENKWKHELFRNGELKNI